jgi:hypothetical protein
MAVLVLLLVMADAEVDVEAVLVDVEEDVPEAREEEGRRGGWRAPVAVGFLEIRRGWGLFTRPFRFTWSLHRF